MDISSLYGSSALDSTAYTNAANQTASKLQDKLNSSDYSKATDDELMDACKQFESYFLEQMFKEMMKTIPESEDTSSSNSQLMDYYKDEMVQQIASDSTEQNSLGLAQMLYEQMKRNYILSKYFGLPFPAALFFIFYRNRGIFLAFRREQPQIHSRMRNKNGKHYRICRSYCLSEQ